MKNQDSKSQFSESRFPEGSKSSFKRPYKKEVKDDSAEMPSASRRVLRVEKELREIVGLHLLGGFHGELEGIVTISRVQVTSDLRGARIYVTVIADEDAQYASVSVLNKYAYEVQKEIAKALPIRYCPKVKFYLDTTLEKVLVVEKILRELSAKKSPSNQTPS